MSGRRAAPDGLPGLHVRMAPGIPTADYRCARCPHTDAGSGPDGVRALLQRAADHRRNCPQREDTP